MFVSCVYVAEVQRETMCVCVCVCVCVRERSSATITRYTYNGIGRNGKTEKIINQQLLYNIVNYSLFVDNQIIIYIIYKYC